MRAFPAGPGKCILHWPAEAGENQDVLRAHQHLYLSCVKASSADSTLFFSFTCSWCCSFLPSWCNFWKSRVSAQAFAFPWLLPPHRLPVAPSFLIPSVSLWVMRPFLVIGCLLIVRQTSSSSTKRNWCVRAVAPGGGAWIIKHVPPFKDTSDIFWSQTFVSNGGGKMLKTHRSCSSWNIDLRVLFLKTSQPGRELLGPGGGSMAH